MATSHYYIIMSYVLNEFESIMQVKYIVFYRIYIRFFFLVYFVCCVCIIAGVVMVTGRTLTKLDIVFL